MNWKAILGSIGMGALAPFTGGASLATLPGIIGAGAAMAPGVIAGVKDKAPNSVTTGPAHVTGQTPSSSNLGNTKGILSSILGGAGKVFGKGGIDPTTALLGGMSLLGGNGQNPPESFKGTPADPVKTMTDTLAAIDALSAKVAARGPSQLRSPLSPTGQPSPVTLPGIPFQIGGGLGSDPSIPADPSKAKLRTP